MLLLFPDCPAVNVHVPLGTMKNATIVGGATVCGPDWWQMQATVGRRQRKFLNPAAEVGIFNDRVTVEELPVNPE